MVDVFFEMCVVEVQLRQYPLRVRLSRLNIMGPRADGTHSYITGVDYDLQFHVEFFMNCELYNSDRE